MSIDIRGMVALPVFLENWMEMEMLVMRNPVMASKINKKQDRFGPVFIYTDERGECAPINKITFSVWE